MIYFIMSERLVKIGHSNDPKRRFASLATGCPTPCTLIGVMEGGKAEEGRIHALFAAERVRGEWFNFTVEINSFLSKNAVAILPEPTPNPHPLAQFIRNSGKTIGGFASEVGVSRMMLHRIMNGEPTRTSSLSAISAATGGKVSVSDLLVAYEQQRAA